MKPKLLPAVILTVILVVSSSVQAYLSRVFDVRWMLDTSSLVCHGRVLSVKPHRIEKDPHFRPPLPTGGAIAKVRVINVIKGRARSEINVLFRTRPMRLGYMVVYTELVKGEECILFLRSNTPEKPHYRFVDDDSGKLRVPPHEPIKYESESPRDRMVAELKLATEIDTGTIRLVCAEQLANFPCPEAVSRLKELAANEDMAVQGIAYAALIRLDEPPEPERLVAFLARQDDTKSFERFRTTAYRSNSLKAAILESLQGRLNTISGHYRSSYTRDPRVGWEKTGKAMAERWKTFDLIGFLKTVPLEQCYSDFAPNNPVIIRIIRNQLDDEGIPASFSGKYREGTVSVLVRLLESDNIHLRFQAAHEIDGMIPDDHEFSMKNQNAYVQDCRDWLAKHKEWAEK